MTAKVMDINSEDNAWDFIAKALEGTYDNEVIELNFENWPVLAINIKGDRYHSTLPSSLMRSLVEFQSHLNRIYAEVIYGKSAKSLQTEERVGLEIVFTVKEGSTELFADLSGFFTELGRNAMDRMTGRQVVAMVLGVAVIYAGSTSYDAYLANHEKENEENNRHKIEMQLLQQQPRLMEMQNELTATMTNVLKAVQDAKSVKLNRTSLTKGHIEMITKQDRQPTELKRIDNEYLISSLKIKPDSYRIEIIRIVDGKSIQTDLYKGHLSFNEMDYLMKAFTSEKPIFLNVVGRVKGETITTANIVGVGDTVKSSIAEPTIAIKSNVDDPAAKLTKSE
jgi:hypothetical protein